jgi:hypothetical protein
MPLGFDGFEKWSKKLEEVKFSGMGEKFKQGFTKRRAVIIVILLLIIAFLAIIVPFASFYTDALWYNHLGFQNLFWKMFWAKILMVVIFGAVFFVLLYTNIYLARKIPPSQKISAEGSPLESVIIKIKGSWGKFIRIGTVVFCLLAAFFSGLGWGGKWETVLKFLNHTSFGTKDPIFNKDIGFYAFSYPFQRALVDWLMGSLIFIIFVTAVVYLFTGGIRPKRGPDMLAPHVKAHLSVLLALIFLVKAWSYRLNMYEVLFSKNGVVYGAGYTDVHARLPALWIMFVLALLAVIILLVNIWYRGWILPAIAVVSLIVVAFLAGTVYPLIIQNYRVKPNELSKESPYLKYNIDFTRQAYKLNEVQVKPFEAGLNLNLEGILRNRTTVKNIRLWDPRPLLDTYQQLQSIRQYYSFNDVGVDRYTIDNVYRQTMIGAREMVQAQLPESARTWVNNTLVYTHGYGVCLNASNDVSEEGNPVFLIKDIPPRGPTNLQVKRPEIYFGEKSNDYIVVDSSEKEFDYPKGNQKIYTVYKGDGGVRVNSFWRKMLFTINFRDINLLLSGQVSGDSQVMYHRNIKDRISKCAPFLEFDQDPYMVLSDDGKLYWVADGYTTTDKFPYSQPTGGLGNYIRNSVKAVVDAYNGKVRLFVADPKDPIIATYQKIFPQIFTSFDKMPPELRKHLRYPEDFFVAQSNILRTYHMTDPKQFYSKEDEWDFPQESFDGKQPLVPYYIILKLPGEQGEEMVLMLPFVPHGKQNMISWLGARMDGVHYGEMINYTFPSGRLIYGPEQIEGRIEQDPEISRQLSLWRQAGSQVIRGNLLVIPLEQSLLYVEPLYLQATQTPIPQVKRVVVVYGQQVVMEPTLDQAIARIFAGATPSGVTQPSAQKPTGNVSDLAKQALDLYNKALEAQKAGDWAAYGNYLKQLSDILNQIAGAK